MEFKIIEAATFDRLAQCLSELLKKSNKLKAPQLEEEWWDNQYVSQLLGVSLRTLQNWRDKGLIPYSQVGHKCFYKIKDVENFIDKNRHE